MVEQIVPNDAAIPGESFTSGIRQMPYDRPPEMTDNREITNRLWDEISQPERMREINALLEIGTPVDDMAAQISHGLFREGKVAPQNAVMILPSLTVMLARIGEAFGTDFKLTTDEKNPEISEAEILAAIKRSEKSDSDMNNKEARGFKAVAKSRGELSNNADNVAFLQDAKEKI